MSEGRDSLPQRPDGGLEFALIWTGLGRTTIRFIMLVRGSMSFGSPCMSTRRMWVTKTFDDLWGTWSGRTDFG